MEYSNISALLEKYWACETNEVEELQLREFYATHEGSLPPDLQEAAPLFRYFHEEGEGDAMPELFTDVKAPWETATVIRPFWHGWMKYAAVLLVGIGMGYAVNQYLKKSSAAAGDTYAMHDTYNDPKLAYQETQKALQILSKNLNKGKTQMEKLSYLSDATEMLQGGRN
jgi:hypothetical protein